MSYQCRRRLLAAADDDDDRFLPRGHPSELCAGRESPSFLGQLPLKNLESCAAPLYCINMVFSTWRFTVLPKTSSRNLALHTWPPNFNLSGKFQHFPKDAIRLQLELPTSTRNRFRNSDAVMF